MRAKLNLCFTTAESRVKIWLVSLSSSSQVASAAIHSKVVVLLLFTHCWLLLPLFVGLNVRYLVCFAVLCVHL